MRIVWIGPVVSEERLLDARSVFSPAGVRWNAGFVGALVKKDVEVRNIYYAARRTWPYGPLRLPASNQTWITRVQSQWVPYWNVRGMRARSLALGYSKVFKQWCKSGWNADVLVVYNPSAQDVKSACGICRLTGTPWIVIQADKDPSGVEPEVCIELGAAGIVFLAWGAYERFPYAQKIHIDGGVSELRGVAQVLKRTKRVAYNGALHSVAGADFLVKAFRQVRHPEARLDLTGTCLCAGVAAAAAQDRRVTLHGLLPDVDLQDVCSNAELFVNPRPSNRWENAHNFPSKILEYLSWSRPVVTTWTAGLHPDYIQITIPLRKETYEGLAEAIDDVLTWTDRKYRENSAAVAAWVVEKRQWSTQVARFLQWAQGELMLHRQQGIAQKQLRGLDVVE